MCKFIKGLKNCNVCITDYVNHDSFFTISNNVGYCNSVRFFDIGCQPLGTCYDNDEYFITIIKFKILYENFRLVSNKISSIENLPTIKLIIVIYKFKEITSWSDRDYISRHKYPNIENILMDGDLLREIKRKELIRNDLFYNKCILKYRFIYKISPSKHKSLIEDIKKLTKYKNENRKTLDLYYDKLRETGPSGVILVNEEMLYHSLMAEPIPSDIDCTSIDTF